MFQHVNDARMAPLISQYKKELSLYHDVNFYILQRLSKRKWRLGYPVNGISKRWQRDRIRGFLIVTISQVQLRDSVHFVFRHGDRTQLLPEVGVRGLTALGADLVEHVRLDLPGGVPAVEWLDELAALGGVGADERTGVEGVRPAGPARARHHLAAALHQRLAQLLRRVLQIVVDAARIRAALRMILYLQTVPQTYLLWLAAVFQVHVDRYVYGYIAGLLDLIRRLLEYCKRYFLT